MYAVELTFECFDNTTLSAVDRAVNGLMDALRYNGQVLGREFPMVMGEGLFQIRAVCPELDSLSPANHSHQVKRCTERLTDAKLLSPKVKILGRDINSEACAESAPRQWQVLYTTFVHTCSPLRCGETLLPIPLYRVPVADKEDHEPVVRWQTEWQACDEIQMIGGCQAKHATLAEIQDPASDLFRRGKAIQGRIERLTQVPTYYYQYRVGGSDLQSELDRLCPSCGSEWRLNEPLHDVFHFKCDTCRLVSNLSWDFQ